MAASLRYFWDVDSELAHKLCRLIAGIVIADDDLAPSEEAFIDRLIAQFGLAAEDRDALFPIIDGEEAAAEMAELEPDVQHQAFGLLLEAAAADIAYADGAFTIVGTDRSIDILDLADRARGRDYLPEDLADGLDCEKTITLDAWTFPNGCHVAEV